MEAWRNITALNYTNPSFWFQAMNATTSQWRVAPLNSSSVVILTGYITNDTKSPRYPNTTYVIEGAGATLAGTKPIDFVSYLALSLSILAVLALPLFRWVDAMARPESASGTLIPRTEGALEHGAGDENISEREFWTRVRLRYNTPRSAEEPVPKKARPYNPDNDDDNDDDNEKSAAFHNDALLDIDPNEEIAGQFGRPVGAADVHRVVELLRRLYRVENEIRIDDMAVGVSPERRMARKRQVNAIAAVIHRTVEVWERYEPNGGAFRQFNQWGAGPAGGGGGGGRGTPWDDDERACLQRILYYVRRLPKVPFPEASSANWTMGVTY